MARVLVFDESQLVGKLVEYYLKKHGWTVESHIKGTGLQEKFDAFRPDVLLLDPNTPGLESAGLAGLIKEKKEELNCKVICLSCDGSCQDTELAREGLLDGHFVKRYTLDGLKEVIDKTLAAGVG